MGINLSPTVNRHAASRSRRGRRADSPKPPRAFGPRGLCPISPTVYHRAESDAPDEIGTPPPSGRFDKSLLSEYILSAPLFRLPHPTPAACGGSGEAAGGGVRLNSYLSKIKTPSAVITAPTEGRLHAGQSGAEVAHSIPQKAAPVKSRRGRFFVPCVPPERSTDGFQFRGPGVPLEFLRPPATPPARLLPSSHTRPLSSLGEAHRLLRTPEKSSGLRTARPPRWRTWVNSL